MKTNPKQTPDWVRWVYLALAVFQLFMIWVDVREYQQYQFCVESGIFSPAGLQDAFSGHAYRWVMGGLLCILFLFAFAVMKYDLRQAKWSAILGGLLTVMLLAWACLPLFLPLPTANGFYFLMLFAFAGVTIYTWYKYCKTQKRMEDNSI